MHTRSARDRSFGARWERAKEWLSQEIGHSVAFILGWAFVTALLGGAYGVGRWASTYFGWGDEPTTFGLLAASGFVWTYVSLDTAAKLSRIEDRLDRLEPTLWDNDIRPRQDQQD